MSGTGYDPGGTGVPGPPGPAGSFDSLESISDLRALVSVNPEAVVAVRQDGRGGLFFWDVTPAIDNGGTRYNVGGVGTTSAGWSRIPDGPLNAVWFGLGTGDVDNATALQAAVNLAATGVFSGAVYVPAGTYILANGISIPSNVELYGDGPTSHLSVTLPGTDTNAIAGLGATLNNITIRDLRISGAFSRGINLSSTNGTGGSNVHVERCVISGATEFAAGVTVAGIRLAGLDDCWIVENSISGNGFDNGDGTGQGYDIVVDAGVMHSRMHIIKNNVDSLKTILSIVAFDCRDSEIRDNTVNQGNTASVLLGVFRYGYGIAMYDAVNLLQCERNKVEDNNVQNAAGIGIYLESQFNSDCSRNVCFDTCKQITEPSLPLGALVANGSSVTFANNTVKTTNKVNGTSGLVIAGLFPCTAVSNRISGTSFAFRLQGVANGTSITTNEIEDCSFGLYVGNLLNPEKVTFSNNPMQVDVAGIFIDAGATLSNSVIANNPITTGQFGVYLSGGTHNKIINNPVTAGTDYAIRLLAGANNNLIAGNSAIARNFGIIVASNNNIIEENDLSGAAVTKLSVTGTGNIVDDNLGAGPTAGVFMGMSAFNGAGNYTTGLYTNRLRIRLVGAGGGGGGTTTAAASAAAGGGGGAGAYAEWSVAVTPNTAYAFVAGVGGAGGAAGGNGTAGGASTFIVGATTVTAPGGNGGVGSLAGVAVNIQNGGNMTNPATNATINGAGAPGSAGVTLNGVAAWSGNGGSGPFGAGGVGLYPGFAGIAGLAGTGFGSGGGGGMVVNGSAASAGGAGRSGLIIVEEYT